jgi:hypothetical protein
MIIENKKTNIAYEITQSEWQKIIELRKQRLFRIVDGEDRKPSIIQIPEKIIDFQKGLMIGDVKPSISDPAFGKVEIPAEIQKKMKIKIKNK